MRGTDQMLNTLDHKAIRVVINLPGVKVAYMKHEGSRSVRWNKLNASTVTNEYTIPANDFFRNIIQNSNISDLNQVGIDTVIGQITTKLIEFSNNLPRAKFKKHVRPFSNSTLTELKRIKVDA